MEMRKMLKLFTAHPASVDESYVEHMTVASSFGVRMVLGGIACFVHALLPFLFERTASSVIGELHQRMVTHRGRNSHPAAAPASATVNARR
jgi:hypothetical protein